MKEQTDVEAIKHMVSLAQNCPKLNRLAWGYVLTSSHTMCGPDGLLTKLMTAEEWKDIPSPEDFKQLSTGCAIPLETPSLLRLKHFYKEVDKACEFDKESLEPIQSYVRTSVRALDHVLQYRTVETNQIIR